MEFSDTDYPRCQRPKAYGKNYLVFLLQNRTGSLETLCARLLDAISSPLSGMAILQLVLATNYRTSPKIMIKSMRF